MTITDDDIAGVLAPEYVRFIRRFREWGWTDADIKDAILGACHDSLALKAYTTGRAALWPLFQRAVELAFTEEGAYS